MFNDQPEVQAVLKQRNQSIAKFWLSDPSQRISSDSELLGRTVLMVDAEDSFTQMIAQQLKAIGLLVTIRKFDEPKLLEGSWDLIVMGPGPGDPNNVNDSRISCMRKILTRLNSEKHPFLAVCLSHQMLCSELGFEIIRKASPNQGTQREIDFFGVRELAGFYNTYVAKYNPNRDQYINEAKIELCFDAESKEIYAIRGEHFVSFQFHAESLLTRNGINIFISSIKRIIK